MSPDAITRALAELDPYYPSERDGDPVCFFCGSPKGGWNPNQPHSPDCLWAIAQQYNPKAPPPRKYR